MGNTYRPAPDVKERIDAVIFDSYEELGKQTIRIECVYCSAPPKNKGKDLPGKVVKVSGLNAFLASSDFFKEEDSAPESFFVVVTWRDGWDAMTVPQRKYWADYCVAQISVIEKDSGDISRSLLPPDVVTFAGVAARHDPDAMPDVKKLLCAIEAPKQQMKLPLVDGFETPFGGQTPEEVMERLKAGATIEEASNPPEVKYGQGED